MIFSTLNFFLFFIFFYIIFLLTKDKYKIILLIISSLIFYSFWKASYVFLPILLISIAFFGAKWVHSSSKAQKKTKLIISIIILVLPLLLYKYTNFFIQDVIGLFFDFSNINIPHVDLPLGISFITFILIAYIVDIYTGKFKIVDKFQITAVYTLFFPHLISGPIIRPSELMPQFEKYVFSKSMITFGLLIFTIGLFKKIVFADQLGLAVENVYDNNFTTKLDYLIAFYGFPVQIYCDFSGYTDMAIGLALMLGIKFPNNFNRPYMAISFVDFWNRWHITLSKWIKDYIYIPLGGNKKGSLSQSKNILISMGIAGLWHGASWTFIIWGLYHGIFIVLYHLMKKIKYFDFLEKIPKWIKIFIIFHLISIGWILFRADDILQFYEILNGVFFNEAIFTVNIFLINLNYTLLIVIFFILHKFDSISKYKLIYLKLNSVSLYVAIFSMVIFSFLISSGNSAEFIYYDF